MLKESFLVPDRGRVFPWGSPGETSRDLVIALSVKADEYPDRFEWARENGFALEYTPDPRAPERITAHVAPFVKDGIPVRFHTRFPGFELGNADPERAAEALAVHDRVIDAVAGLGEPFVTVHLNLDKGVPFDAATGLENLTRLVRHARARGITVCLENLRKGPSAEPANVVAWAEASGAMLTLDVGHAVSSDIVGQGRMSIKGIVTAFASRLREAHVYSREEDRHYPVEDMAAFAPIVDALLETGCGWWTVELDNYEEALATRQRLLEYFKLRALDWK